MIPISTWLYPGFIQFGRRKIEFHIPDLLHDIFMFFYKTADLVKLKTSHCEIIPCFSAIPINTSGGIIPRTGCFSRLSAPE